MTYENMYNVLVYMKKNNITITTELLEILKQALVLAREDFEILKCDINVIKLYFSYGKIIKEFIIKHLDMAFNELKFYVELIASQDTQDKQKQIRLACENKAIREDEVALGLIVNQNTAEKQRQVRLACEREELREDKKALKLIASQETWEKQEQVRLACENKAIREDEVALGLIVSQETWDKQEQVRLACENKAIREDEVALGLIVNQDTSVKQRVMRLACEREELREDKEALKLIASQETWFMQERMIIAYDEGVFSQPRVKQETVAISFIDSLSALLDENKDAEFMSLYENFKEENRDALRRAKKRHYNKIEF